MTWDPISCEPDSVIPIKKPDTLHSYSRDMNPKIESLLLLNHPKFKRYTWIIIEMLGSATFDELDLVKQSETILVPKIAKRKP